MFSSLISRRRFLLLPVAALLVMGFLVSSGPTFTGRAEAATAYAPSHTFAAVKKRAAMPANTWQKSTIRSKSQRNWYRVDFKSRGYLYALLGNLPTNYNLGLYDASGKKLNASNSSGTSPEKIGRMLNKGSYYLVVASPKGYSKTKSYDLMARVVPESQTIGVLTQRMSRNFESSVIGELVNVSNEWHSVPVLDVSLYDAQGKLLKTYKEKFNGTWVLMAPGSRAPFTVWPEASAAVLKKTASAKVKPSWGTRSALSPAKLKVSAVKKTSSSYHGITTVEWSGKVTNNSSRKVPYITVAVEARDKRGVLVGADFSWGDLPLAAGKTRKFETTYSNWHSGLTYSAHPYEFVRES
ncbi:FxLYD domain-containing protein [Kineosporia sp. NBRC 101731]|uniref:FxLYD domain-containing protein n=1 Tax=Kineosporia sp. NBRC 101731 TaxID=3032199 RepID=UPI0024A2B087|nr:FxLYD domain-containing protein [Kineosporia sp. NBRC 101731]GLY27891.1 hypothetical protein Kisp02_12560 [Kineosporia sp. NBRC 101731]